MKCEICGKEFKNITGLATHIGLKETIEPSEYYKKYINTDASVGFCKTCGKPTTFITLGQGYTEFCCNACVSKNENIKKQKDETFITNGTYKKRSESIKKTMNEKYGVDNPMHVPKFKQKCKDTTTENWGVDCIFKLPEKREEIRDNMEAKYGVRHNSHISEVVEKRKETCWREFNGPAPACDPQVADKSRQKNLKNMFIRLLESDRLKNKVTPNFTLEEYAGVDSNNKYSWTCTTCGCVFEDNIDDARIPRCLKCYPYLDGYSKMEKELLDYVKSIYSGSVLENNRSVLKNRELDIYIPDKNIAIEFDGLFWHSELNGKNEQYHLDKTNRCFEQNIHLIHIFEDEWLNKQDIVKSMIQNKLGLCTNNVYARKCDIKTVDNSEAKEFLDRCHLQGGINGSHFGLYLNDKLVSLMTVGKSRFDDDNALEIYRYSSELFTNVVGGFSRLLKLIEDILNPEKLLSYADKRYSTGNVYKVCGFDISHVSKPSYYYIKDKQTRYNRLNFQKHILSDKLEEYDPNLTEWQNMQLSGYDRIWDCGQLVFVKEYNK